MCRGTRPLEGGIKKIMQVCYNEMSLETTKTKSLLEALTLYPWRGRRHRAAAEAGRSSPGCILLPGGEAWTVGKRGRGLAQLRPTMGSIHTYLF